MPDLDLTQNFTYVVGRERRLAEIIAEGDIVPLLQGVVRAGASDSRITDERGNVLWSFSGADVAAPCIVVHPIYLEGEEVGSLSVMGAKDNESHLEGLAGLLLDAIKTTLANSLKRMLTTEIHTSVVSRSYEELLEINRKLSVSEQNYRELAGNLEKMVEERTEELKKAHARLLQQEKMACIGQLAAGVAHEINNPLGFISSNLRTMDKYTGRFIAMLDFLNSSIAAATDRAALIESAAGKWRELKLDIICNDIGDLISQSLEGAERVRKIVSDLKGFSHVDETGLQLADLNHEIDKTLNVLAHEIHDGTEIVRRYDTLPGFACNAGLMCQVFLNLVLNALQVRREGLRLTIATSRVGRLIRISFTDNGPGIPEEIRHRIFEPFYTTKEVGAGTGMGLTVAYDIITAYGGTIEALSPPEGGASFVITLPERETG